jgi:hypothetical protein
VSQLLYLPRVMCAKCGKVVPSVQRVHDPITHRRYVRATCHGRAAELPFVDEPWKELLAFKE